MPTFPLTLARTDPLEHVVNHSAIKSADGYWLWSANQGNLVLAGLIMVLVGLWAASKIRTGPASKGADAYIARSHFAHFLEVLCVYLRDEVVRPLLPDRTDRFMPFLWTVFFFILVNNLLGLIPIGDILHVLGIHTPWVGGTATQNIWVTGIMAVVAGLVFNIAAVVRLGPVGFVKHMLGGLPLYMAPIAILLFVIELIGQFVIKPGALAIRLFANMTGGHVMLATLLIFAGTAISSLLDLRGVGTNVTVTLVTVGGAFAITMLELFIALMQAFVFMFLIAVFISLMDHHDEHGHEHEQGHAIGHEHAQAA
jgi:F-type H+-transporting ATPase subunit a